MFQQGDVVRHTPTGKVGIVVNDLPGALSVCEPDETLVCFDGRANVGEGTPTDELELVLAVEIADKPAADFEKCGGGRGAETCVFLVIVGDGLDGCGAGPSCARFTEDHYHLLFASMVARRVPLRLYPDCQLPVSEQAG
jgi:hypothetical protein